MVSIKFQSLLRQPVQHWWWIVVILLLSARIVAAEQIPNSEMAGILHRPIRAVVSYPEYSNMGIFFALAVPLEDSVNSVSLSYFFEASYGLPANSSLFASYAETREANQVRRKRSIDRSTVYTVLSNKFQSAGFPGHKCLLRSICEASEHPLEHNGMLGDVLRVVFTPSSSRQEDHLPDGIIEAELKGRNGTCSDYYPLCPLGLFDLIGILL